ncbi:hypothetical protein ACJJTC_005379 [Scirpophaga incertulas]
MQASVPLIDSRRKRDVTQRTGASGESKIAHNCSCACADLRYTVVTALCLVEYPDPWRIMTKQIMAIGSQLTCDVGYGSSARVSARGSVDQEQILLSCRRRIYGQSRGRAPEPGRLSIDNRYWQLVLPPPTCDVGCGRAARGPGAARCISQPTGRVDCPCMPIGLNYTGQWIASIGI